MIDDGVIRELIEGQRRIEALVSALVESREGKAWYTLPEAARLVGRSAERVRKWCAEGRIEAAKDAGGRSEHGEWRISREALERYRSHGLLPPSGRPRLPSPFRPGAGPR